MEDLISKLETETNFHHKTNLFFLVDSITQGGHKLKGTGASYIPIVRTSLYRLITAVAPSVDEASENHKQCLKVLQLWLDRNIFPGSCLQHYVNYFRALNDGTCTSLFNGNSFGVERAVDDQLQEFDGMLIDEYGSNAVVSSEFSPKGRGADGIFEAMEYSSTKRFSPPSPPDPPPPTPPLPSSTMPPPPPLYPKRFSPPSPPDPPPPVPSLPPSPMPSHPALSPKQFSPPSPPDPPPPIPSLPSSPMPPPPHLSSPSPPPPPPPLQRHACAPPLPLPAQSSQFTFLNKILQPPTQAAYPTFLHEGYFRPLEMCPANIVVGVQPSGPSGPPPPTRWPPVGDVGFQPPFARVFTSGPQPPHERSIAINVGFQPPFARVFTSCPQPPHERPIAINVGFQPTAFQVLPSAPPVSARGQLMMPSTQDSSSLGSWGPA